MASFGVTIVGPGDIDCYHKTFKRTLDSKKKFVHVHFFSFHHLIR